MEPPTNEKKEVVLPSAVISSRYEVGSDPALERRIEEGTVVIASVSVYQRWGNHLMFARNPAFPADVVVSGSEAVGRAQHGDVVAIELVPADAAGAAAAAAAVVDQDTPSESDSNPESSTESDSGVEIAPVPFFEDEPDQEQPMPRTLPDGRPIVASVLGENRRKDKDEHPRSPLEDLSQRLHAPTDYAARWVRDGQRHGRVVRVLHREMDAYVVARVADGVLQPGQFVKSNYMYRFRPYNALLPQVAVRGGDIPAPLHPSLSETLLLLRLQASPATGELTTYTGDILTASYVDSLGTADSAEASTMAICSEFRIPKETFSDDVEACVPQAFVIPDAAALQAMGRRDLRAEEFVCTIDPATARDLDDALSIRRTAGGGYHVGVHIADVSFFVTPDTAVDEEAQRRSTSTYFVDRVIPMLPRKLSEDYCSLNPGQDKFAFSCLFELDRDCHVVSEWFGQSVIRSRCRLAYEEAQKILDNQDVELDVTEESRLSGKPTAELLAKVHTSVTLLYEVARTMRQESLQHGRVAIPNLKLGFLFDDMNSRLAPKGFVVVRQIFANWVVEEFMLLANTRTAQKIVQYLPHSALLRHHPPPTPEKVAKLKAAAEVAGMKVYGASANALQRTIDDARESPHFSALCVLMKYTLSAAKYMVNDVDSTIPRSHFALGLDWYTHFTSPIRRYSDIMAHRQLLLAVEVEAALQASGQALPSAADAAVQPKPGAAVFDAATAIDPDTLVARDYFYTHNEVDTIAENANLRKEAARRAGDKSIALFFCLYLRAVIKKSAVDPRFPAHPCAKMVVIQVKPSSIVLFAEAVACELEIGLRDKTQLFELVVPPAEGEDDDETATDGAAAGAKAPGARKGPAAETAQHAKEKSKRRSKGGKANVTKHDAKKKDGASVAESGKAPVRLSWGINPETNELCIEEVSLFAELTAELITSHAQGPMQVAALLIPPWIRERAFATQGTIPASLE